MPVVEISDVRKYNKAVAVLVRLGGTFRTKPDRLFIVSPVQHQALADAGLVQSAPEKPKKRS